MRLKRHNSVASSTVPLNTWTFVAATYDGSNLRVYLNGTLASTVAVSGSIAISNGVLHIGGDSVWGEWFQDLTVNGDSSKTSTTDVVLAPAAGASVSVGSINIYGDHVTSRT